jgi:tetratricopeptide (TPR) repeat protein
MPLIRIQDRPGWPDGSNAILSFDHGPEYPITISDPFTEKEEQELEWYFEDHLTFPFTNKVRAQHAAASITTYGEQLFKQVFGDAEISAEYSAILKSGLSNLQIEIAGSPQFHALHWEAMRDPKTQQLLALHATILRKNIKPQNLALSAQPSPTINLLIVTARPSGRRDVGYRTISRPLVEALDSANIPVQVEILRPGTYKALENHLRESTDRHQEGYYHVIHFDVHGAVLSYEQLQQGQQANRFVYQERYARQDLQPYEGDRAFLSFESEQEENKADLVEASELARLLIAHHIPIAILNACQSGKQMGERETSLGSHLVQAGVQFVLAMGYSVTVSAAELLMKTLYAHLFANAELPVAIRDGRMELYNHKERRAYFDQQIDLEDWLLPVAYQNAPVPLRPREFTLEERKAWFERKAEEAQYRPPAPTYGFVGRDLDILSIERCLLAKRNLLLIRGMGGAGKTTLLRHLAAWWHTTGFIERVFYFGYDDKAWTLQQIMTTIAQDLYGPRYYTDFQPLSPKAQQAMLAQDLRSNNHLLILDNLESITGTHLAIQHTLPPDEQAALHSFLTDLARGNGKTRVLLGSRSGEAWLAKGTFDDNVYDLGGLDDEAASTLADRILERNHATQYRKDEQEQENLKKLIKVLDGFPLALEVVLANLAHQAPAQVLEALQAGDVSLDIDESKQKGKSIFEQKTESILRCIDYSHSNLSPEAQQLLLCLAPFTSVIDTQVLNNYTNQLRQQPALASLPFERWPEVIREAQNWGLLSPDPAIPRFLRLQPIFPYFLRNRLGMPGQAEIRHVVETAFREHYNQVGRALYDLLHSKEPQEWQVGQILTSLEYENLVTSLRMALAAQVSIFNLYFTLSKYLDATQEQRRGLELGQTVLSLLEAYPTEKLSGQLGAEFVAVIDNIAKRQLLLKQYKEAEASYQKALAIHLALKIFDAAQKAAGSASIYHQLGRVAQEQRQWAQAEQYYQQALQIYIEYNDRHKQATTYHNLGAVAQEQRQWAQAEQYYQQALQIYIEYNDRYEQADTYHNLGMIAQQQRQWQQAREYFLLALETFVTYEDNYSSGVVLRSLARLWQSSNDASLPAAIANVLGASVEETEKLLREVLGDKPGEAGQ